MTDPNCPWCRGIGYVCGDGEHHVPWNNEHQLAGKPGVNCPRCNPRLRRPLTDAEMDAWVSRGITPADLQDAPP
jgi:hypothetical protein